MSSKELEIELFLNNNIDILCITEHWYKKNEMLLNFGMHQLASSFCREKAIRGGSLVLINKNIKYKERKDIVSLSTERTTEIACIEVGHFIIVGVYRPPLGLYDSFENTMEILLSKISTSNKNILLCGDFNINILDNSSTTVRFTSLLKSYNLTNLFYEPTRISDSSATCIDNIFTNIDPLDKKIINKLSSDHCGQLAIFPLKKNNKQSCKNGDRCVPINVKRIEKFRGEIMANIEHLKYHINPNTSFGNLFKIIKLKFDNIFTSTRMRINNKSKFSEWATEGILISRIRLYELYSEKAINQSEDFKTYVRLYSKTFKRVCSAAKSLYIKNKIKNSKNIVKTTWKIIAEETGRVTSRNTNFKLNIDNKIIKSDNEVATVFEKFFADVPVSTTKTLNASPAEAEILLKENVKGCDIEFRFREIGPQDIIKNFNILNIKHTADLWGLSTKVIKSIIDIIAPYLATIFNDCIKRGVFPDLMKHSKVLPLFKSGSRSDPTNFRPISILPTLSKIFEKIMLNQLLVHFNINKILHNKQFGFTKGRSTTDAGADLINYIFGAWEESQDALGIFCDLSKAFDCVDHKTLIRKLCHYGVKGSALALLKSYLSNRIQRVEINGKRSTGTKIEMGVPQGSILGPFLFLIYINDLPYLIDDKNGIVLFADDTSLTFKVKRKNSSYDEVNNALSKIVHWFSINNLLLNSKKTKCIKFTLPNVKQTETNVLLNGEGMQLINTAVFLGITIDAKLQWGPHIARLADRLSSAAFAVGKIRQFSDESTARLVYFSYFHSIMSYGILLWGNAADINTIFVLQKRAVRAIYKLAPRTSLREKFKETGILTVASQYVLSNLLYVKKNIDQFKRKCDIHNRNTRNKHKLEIPATRLSKVKNSFKGQCIRLYNKIPENVQNLSVNKFKKVVKERLCARAYYKINDFMNDSTQWE